ncbi:MAG: hypothetical protein ABI883_04025 [Chthoniobacterales bacterium]
MTPSRSADAPTPTRRWPGALLVGLLTSIAGAALCLPVADWGMEIHHASHFEGSSDYGVVFIWMPFAAIVGFVTGFLASFCTRRRGLAGFLLRQTLALFAIAAVVALGGAVTYALADHPHPPTIDGKRLALQVELRVPTQGRTLQQLQATGFAARMDAEGDHTPHSALRWNETVITNEFITVPMDVQLNSQTTDRVIAVWDGHESWHTFRVATPAAPATCDEEWSDWLVRKTLSEDGKQRPMEECHARYRVRFADERPMDSDNSEE